jgi:CelD/BcsL family acetyltransferase involved in cellulose biosynthesis
LGPVSFSVSRGSQGSLGLLLDKGFAAEGSGWKAEHGTAIVSRPETERFYREIAAWAASRGMLRLAFLHVGDRVAAFQIALTGQGTWYALKSGFNPEFRAGSPGKLLMHETLRHAISAEIASYRMGAVEGYKLRWANTFTSLSQIQAFPPSVLGRVDWAAFRYGRPMAESLRRLRGTSRRPGGDATAETPG